MGTLLDFKEYLLYSNHSKTQPRINFKNSTNSICDSNRGCVESSNETANSGKIYCVQNAFNLNQLQIS